MKKSVLYVLFFYFTTLQFFGQENGVVALVLPVRNSLKFNKQVINPTFSFVREQNSYISFSNKRQTQFEGAPQSYIFGYSGRISENNGAGITLFQRDYGVFTNFGGIVNFAHNVVLGTDSNLTFGLNIGAYKSGLNNANVISNSQDPSLDNVPDNFLLTIAPGINYGMAFFDVGVSVNNLVSYNTTTSGLIEENPEKAFQAHIMYTGYMDSGGFFFDSKFSTLVRSEFKKDKTILSGLIMLSVPKGFWGQVGYNTLYGASAGVGFNLTKQIALEYNYEQSISALYDLGSAHEITLAYRFNKKKSYSYSGDDEEVALFQTKNKFKKRTAIAKSQPKTTTPKTEPVAVVAKELEKEPVKLAQIETKEKPEVSINTKSIVKTQPKATNNDSKAKLAQQEVKVETQEAKPEVINQETAKVASVNEEETSEVQQELVQLTNSLNIKHEELIAKLSDKVESKQKDLDAMKEENDLSEKGIYVEPRPFKSISAENAAIDEVKLELDKFIEELNFKITELETVYISVKKKEGEKSTNGIHYYNTIEKLKEEKLRLIARKNNLENNLKQINVATEIERKRRIKRALYDDDQDRFVQDKAALKNIVETTPLSNETFTEEDFDLGDVPSSGIQILKDVKNVENGYYLVVAVHSDVNKRNEVLRKIVSSGEKNIDFFYDVNTSKYYIYYKKYSQLSQAQTALGEKGMKPYNSKMTLIKIE